MAEKRRWWQYNPDKVRGNVEEARRGWRIARQGRPGELVRPLHPDFDEGPADGDDYCDPGPYPGDRSIQDRLEELRSYFDKNLIPAQEYERRMAEILREV